MEEHIKTVEGLIKALAEAQRENGTWMPFLQVAAGGLQTARDNLKKHVEHTAAKAKPAAK